MKKRRAKRKRIVVYKLTPGLLPHEGDWEDWDFETPDADDYNSSRAKALYRALDSTPADVELHLAVHRKSGRWGLFGLRVEGHQYAVEAD